MALIPLVLLGLLGAEEPIDGFQYADTAAARRVWTAGAHTPPPVVVARDDRPVVRVEVPFASDREAPRVYLDGNLRQNLAAPGGFALEIACDDPAAVAHLTLYFRSGDGWYGATGSLAKQGWQTLRFSKASFRAEGRPAGWHKIDGVRIAAWRGQAKDTAIRLRRLAAVRHEVALVIPNSADEPGDGEVKSALAAADRLAALLAELGLGSDAVDERSVAQGALGRRRVAVLAYNPRLADESIAALERFVLSGGKLLVCYCLPARLAGTLGFRRGSYHRQQRPGSFAEIRFDAADIPGLPAAVEQASWNIATAEPAGNNARVIARWFDDAGRPTGRAAMLLSDRGAYFSHLILSDDRAGKRQMLSAVLGKLDSSLWRQMADAEMARVWKIGHCKDGKELRDHAAKFIPLESPQLDAASRAFQEAENLCRRRQYCEAIRQARKAHQLLTDAYLRLQLSPQREGRAVWNHSGTGAYPSDWRRSAKVLAESGFNMILPNMLWAGRAHYPSDVLPRSATFEKYGDQVKQCCEAAERYGLEVHVWKVNYNLSGAPGEFVEQFRRQGRLQKTAGGREYLWLCPSHPQNKKLELESMLEVARKYPVAGLHFDYIRYPGGDCCYCDGCRQRFEAHLGRKVENWPADCHSGRLKEQYGRWRCRQITDLVAAVHREGKRLRPELKISAAVFGSYPSCRRSVGQNWPEWIKAGYLDFVCPMDYTNSDLSFSNLVAAQMELVGGRIPVYPGIGATASRSGLSADRVVGQIHHARRLGAAGFTIFNFSPGTAETIIPGVGLGAGAKKAIPPHASRQ